MNIIKYLLLLILPIAIVKAQELDSSYLDSLPEDIREDLMERADANMSDSQENYRSSLYSSSLTS